MGPMQPGGWQGQWPGQKEGLHSPGIEDLGPLQPGALEPERTALMRVTGSGFLKTICTSHSWPTTAAPSN